MLLIGAIFNAPEVYHQAVEMGVGQESFSAPEPLLLWTVTEKIIKGTNAIDRYSILTELNQRGHKAAMEVVDSIPTDVSSDTAKIHIEAVRTSEKKRKLDTIIRRYIRDESEPDKSIPAMAADLMSILQNSGSHKVRTFADIEPQVVADLEAIKDGRGDHLIGYDSWISPANYWAVPYPKGKVSVVAAYRNAGKSTLCKQEMLHHARQGVKVGLITMEDTDRDVYTNTVTVDGAGFMWKYQQGQGDMAMFKNYSKGLRDLPIYVIDAPQKISELETSMTLLKAKYGVEMLYLDHLHEVMGDHRYQNIDDKYSDIMERIVSTVKRLNVGCCLFAQFSRDCEKEGRKPQMRDLKGSSKIEQAARRIYMLYKDPETGDFIYEGSKISNSAAKDKDQRQVRLSYAKYHDGFELA
jgi:replicative DNA helicase